MLLSAAKRAYEKLFLSLATSEITLIPLGNDFGQLSKAEKEILEKVESFKESLGRY